MKNISKPFEVWATNFRTKPFLFARLKLSASYTLGVLIILAIFNLLVFGLFVKDLPDALETTATEFTEERLENVLFAASIFIVFFVAFMSYFLAGLALKPLEKSDKKQKMFIANVAHELRTPLAVMKTGAQTVLKSKASKTNYKKLTQDSLGEINHLSGMVNDLLFLAKNDSIKKPQFTKLNLSKLIHQQTLVMLPHARRQKVVLKSVISNDIYINGNKDYLKRLLYNLIGNAIEYNKPKGKVSVSLKKRNDTVVLIIDDTGIGISQKDLPYIYDRFYKADKSRTQKSAGAGLGLAIVKEIVEMHQASITINSKLKQGTTVKVLFPQS